MPTDGNSRTLTPKQREAVFEEQLLEARDARWRRNYQTFIDGLVRTIASVPSTLWRSAFLCCSLLALSQCGGLSEKTALQVMAMIGRLAG